MYRKFLMAVDFTSLPARLQQPVGVEPFHVWVSPDGSAWTLFYRIDGGYLLRFPGLADFHVSAEGSRVRCWPMLNVSDPTLNHLYLNQVFPLILSRQGKLVFHASAVEFEGGAIAFVAASGRGKSTLAASFAISGYRFLSDDGLVVEPTGDGYQILPSHPSIRLWGDSGKVLLDRHAKTAPPLPFTSKTRFLAGVQLPHCDQPLPLRKVYFLGEECSEGISFRRLSEADAFVEWVKHSFLLDVEDRPMQGDHFDRVATLATQIRCYHLDYPRRFEHLSCLQPAIEKHAKCDEVGTWS